VVAGTGTRGGSLTRGEAVVTDVVMELNQGGVVTTLKVSYEIDPESGQIDIWKVRRELDKKIVQLNDDERGIVEDRIRGGA